ncbi:hypothetical protein [Polymorphospora sp. NPDC050346]|uniref:hypothetical protein n=1 Tax=Polymorphospora sp. NPDC050346 TaxID=3155780 RepID=UPI0034003F4A
MVKWIVLGVVLFALLVLFLAVRPLLGRLPGLQRAALTLQSRQDEVASLQHTAVDLQDRIEKLQEKLEVTQRRMEVIQARRGK